MSVRKPKTAATESPATKYLGQIARRMRAIKRDLPRLTAMGERMAQPLLKGGNMNLHRMGRFWGSEFGHRAGGLMGMRYLDATLRNVRQNSVVYFELPRPHQRTKDDQDMLRTLVESSAQLFVVGCPEDADGVAPIDRFSGFTGGQVTVRGQYRLPGFDPLVSTDLFERVARGWVVAGEMIAACTRAGRMPIVYMSNWLEGSIERNRQFMHGDRTRGGALSHTFHGEWGQEGTTIYVPPIAAGHMGLEFLRGLERIRSSLAGQAPVLARAGRMLAEAKREGHQISASAAGHCFPHALGIPKESDYPVHWGAPESHLPTSIPRSWGKGDASIHLGYGPTHAHEVKDVLRRGIRLIQTSPYGRPADLPDRKGHVWFDLPWRPGDAEVYVPGYSVRILPASSSAHTMAYFSLLSELAQQMGWV